MRFPLQALVFTLIFGLAASARATVVAPSPGREVVVVREDVLLVFDPLTAQQTVIVQHTFEGTSAPFGLLIPTPKPADVRIVPGRLRRAIDATLHPRASTQRTLNVEIVSWVGSCAVRDVGEPPAGLDVELRTPDAEGEASTIGAAPEPLHDWLLNNGFTLAPAQAAWLMDLRARGWSVVGIVVKPPVAEGPPPPNLHGPVIALTHEAEEPIYGVGHPAFAVVGDAGGRGPGEVARLQPPLEIAVLTEYAVAMDVEHPAEPFFADTLSGRDVSRLAGESGGLAWGFRRDGTLTAYDLERPLADGVLRFARTESRPVRRPEPLPEPRAHLLRLPLEVLLAAIALLVWTWMRHVRGPARGARVRLKS